MMRINTLSTILYSLNTIKLDFPNSCAQSKSVPRFSSSVKLSVELKISPEGCARMATMVLGAFMETRLKLYVLLFLS